MLTEHDQRALRCRRLGHEVTFQYCRSQEGGSVCPCVFDCWWETFDVYAFLQGQMARADFTALCQQTPRPKVLTILDMVERARHAAADRPSGEGAPSP